MKAILKYIGLVLLTVLSHSIQSQSIQVDFKSESVGSSLDADIKSQLKTRVQAVVQEYYDIARFDNTSDYINFETLFSDEPELYNDLVVKPKRTRIDLVDYLSKVETSLISFGGFPFELNNLQIVDMGISDNQLYFVKIEGSKLIQQKIDRNGTPKRVNQDEAFAMFIEVNPYDMDDAKIYRITGSKKIEVASGATYRIPVDNRVSLSPRFGIGSITNSGPTVPSVLEEANSSVLSYGVELEYRRNIDKRGKWYGIVGVIGEIANITTDISSFNLAGAMTNEGLPLPDATVPFHRVDLFTGDEGPIDANASLLPFEFVNGEEKLNLTILQGKLGLGYVISELGGIGDKLFVDLNFHVNVINNRSDGDIVGELFGLKLPVGYDFPDIDQLYNNGILTGDRNNLRFQDIQVDEYKGMRSFTDGAGSEFDITPETNLSFGLSLSPTYHNQITKRFGFVIALDYYYSITSLFKNKEVVNGLFIGDNFNSRSSSVLEDYFGTNRLGRFGGKVGVVLRF